MANHTLSIDYSRFPGVRTPKNLVVRGLYDGSGRSLCILRPDAHAKEGV